MGKEPEMSGSSTTAPMPSLRRNHATNSTRHLAAMVAASFAIATLPQAWLTPPARAQENFPESDRQKAGEARKKGEHKATDEAYEAMIKRTKDINKTADPWGNLRTPAPAGNK
jgi:hypothetical protein